MYNDLDLIFHPFKSISLHLPMPPSWNGHPQSPGWPFSFMYIFNVRYLHLLICGV